MKKIKKWKTSEHDIQSACNIDLELAEGILFDLDNDAVEKAALNGNNYQEQIGLANKEIRNQFEKITSEN